MFIRTFFGLIGIFFSENQFENFFFLFSGTTFETAEGEYSPQNVSTGTLNLVLIVIVLLTIFISAITVAFGILLFRRHQGRMNQGKLLALFAFGYLKIIPMIRLFRYRFFMEAIYWPSFTQRHSLSLRK